jgi:hypothetical protein
MTKPAEIVAAIYEYLPASVQTRAVMESGQAITSDLLVETLDRSVADGLNLAFHCAGEGLITQVFEKLEERNTLFTSASFEKATDEEKDRLVRSYLAFECSTPFLSAVKVLRKLELEIPLLDHVEVKQELIDELTAISKRQSAEREMALSKQDADVDNQIFDSIYDAVSPFHPVIPMIRQLSSACVLESIKETGHSSLDLWQQCDLSRMSKHGFTVEGLKNQLAISEHVIKHNADFLQPSKTLGFVGRQLKQFSPEDRISLVSDAISSVSGFSSEDLASSGAVFYFSMLRLALENPSYQAKAFELADSFHQKFFTQPAAKAHFLGIFDGNEYGAHAPEGMLAAIATKEVFEQNPALAYEILSRVNKLHPDFDVKNDPSKLLTLTVHEDFVSTPLAFYLAKDPNNEQIVRDSITNTWQLEMVDSVTASSPAAKKRRAQENDTGFSM